MISELPAPLYSAVAQILCCPHLPEFMRKVGCVMQRMLLDTMKSASRRLKEREEVMCIGTLQLQVSQCSYERRSHNNPEGGVVISLRLLLTLIHTQI